MMECNGAITATPSGFGPHRNSFPRVALRSKTRVAPPRAMLRPSLRDSLAFLVPRLVAFHALVDEKLEEANAGENRGTR